MTKEQQAAQNAAHWAWLNRVNADIFVCIAYDPLPVPVAANEGAQ